MHALKYAIIKAIKKILGDYMENRRLLVIIRYMVIALLLLGIAVHKQDNVDAMTVILILIFIMNNQLRFFTFQNKKPVVAASVLLECVLSYACYRNYGGIVLFYYLAAALDGAFLIDGKQSYLLNALVLAVMMASGRNLSLNEIISNLSALLTLSILAFYIRDEQARRIEAQNLYDKLRVSEEELKKANKDLELYANSVEELTLLRERNRISREIHDSVGHSLSTIIIQLGAIEKTAGRDGKTASDLAANLREFAKNSLQEVRNAVRELKPGEYGIYEGILAVEELVKGFRKLTGIDVKLGFSEEKWVLNSEQSLAIYRVVQEFLSNAARHGKATKVGIYMNFTKNSIVITLRDNGKGAEDIKEGVGLRGMHERVNELGGTVEYSSTPGDGFFLRAAISKCRDIDYAS